MEDYFDGNRKLWDGYTRIHVNSAFYDLPAFKKGKNALEPMDIEEVGAVAGKSLLHLQCHFGMTTLSWARMGAVVTGVDLSGESIHTARSLAEELNIPAHFIEANIYDLPAALDEQFDIVYTSYGVLNWLPDLKRWAQIVAGYVKPGGIFYLADYHPFSWVFADETPQLEISYDYFYSQVLKMTTDGTYADQQARLEHKDSYEWQHTMSEIINSLLQVGLHIEFLHEFSFCNYPRLPFMEKRADGYWHLPEGIPGLPWMYSIRARKPG